MTQDTFALSDEIAREWLESPGDRASTDYAIQLLMTKCADLFANEEAAFQFLMEAQP